VFADCSLQHIRPASAYNVSAIIAIVDSATSSTEVVAAGNAFGQSDPPVEVALIAGVAHNSALTDSDDTELVSHDL
jgi:hypothetical protein